MVLAFFLTWVLGLPLVVVLAVTVPFVGRQRRQPGLEQWLSWVAFH
jgi:hypothetical protein